MDATAAPDGQKTFKVKQRERCPAMGQEELQSSNHLAKWWCFIISPTLISLKTLGDFSKAQLLFRVFWLCDVVMNFDQQSHLHQNLLVNIPLWFWCLSLFLHPPWNCEVEHPWKSKVRRWSDPAFLLAWPYHLANNTQPKANRLPLNPNGNQSAVLNFRGCSTLVFQILPEQVF